MHLHFAVNTGRDEAADEMVARLQELQRDGRLTRQEQATLALYLPSEPQPQEP